MTERELELLGFKKQIITDAESGNGYDFHFYTYNIAKNLTFISCANDEAECDDFAIENWNVKIAETVPAIEFDNFGEMQGLINLLEKKIT
tara:strand:- start:5576 stop:5845 length:270 start_codon:yes stop_codon:yes gene_type:complete